jgi:hypothetical protein
VIIIANHIPNYPLKNTNKFKFQWRVGCQKKALQKQNIVLRDILDRSTSNWFFEIPHDHHRLKALKNIEIMARELAKELPLNFQPGVISIFIKLVNLPILMMWK